MNRTRIIKYHGLIVLRKMEINTYINESENDYFYKNKSTFKKLTLITTKRQANDKYRIILKNYERCLRQTYSITEYNY